MKITKHIQHLYIGVSIGILSVGIAIANLWYQLAYPILTTIFLIIFCSSCIIVYRSIFSIQKQMLLLQKKAAEATDNIERLQKSNLVKEQQIKELSTLTYALDQTLLYARVHTDGTIISIGQRFAKLILASSKHKGKNIAEYMKLGELQRNSILQLIAQNKGGVFNEEFFFQSHHQKKIWLNVSILSVFKPSGTVEKLLICTDITKRKEAKTEIEELRALHYQKQEERQKTNASLIVEAQEEERKRIAKEIHDSIGQMLTALKFNIESINPAQVDKMNQKIEGLKKLSKDLIQGIRMATFNLTPPELKDYGVIKALQKMTYELNRLTNKNIIFEDQTSQILRFDSLVETNLYRVTQEAINNAVKYAEASFIMVTINASENLLSITIQDNGKGFDINSIPSKPKNNAEGGMGLFFMKERMNYINGRIFINSAPNNGTRITLNYPMNTT